MIIEVELLVISILLGIIAWLLFLCLNSLKELLSQEDARVAEEDTSANSNAQMIDLGREDRDSSSGPLTEAQEDELDDLDRKLAEQDL